MASAAASNVSTAGNDLWSPALIEEHPTSLAARIGSRFAVASPQEAFDFPQKGNINQDTFLLVCGRAPTAGEYLLQRINQQVFTRPRSVMAAMVACLEAQRRGLARKAPGDGRAWEAITLLPTREGAPYLECRNRRGTTYWRLMVKIADCRTCKSLGEIRDRREQLFVAEEAGRGLALFGDLTADMDISALESPLPGYRDTQLYFDQLDSVLAGHRTLEAAAALLPKDAVVRESTQRHFLVHNSPEEHRRRTSDPGLRPAIELALAHRELGLTLARERAAQRIRTVAIHGDTKLENFLFDARNGRVKALVDLDTIMPQTWLADWGDMVRSLVNVAGEKEPDVAKVQVDMEIYRALARGFLSTASAVTPREVELMVEAVEIITLELGLRFLTDYLRGDSYFRLAATDPPDLNRIRGLAQLALFERLRARHDQARAIIEECRPRR